MNASGIGPASHEAFFSIPRPIVLDDFRAFWEDATHVTLRWRGNGGASRIFLDVGRTPGVTEATIPLPSSGSEFRIPMSQVPPGVYYLRVRAENISGVGPPSNEVRFSRTCESPPAALFDFFARYEAGQIFVGTFVHSTEPVDHFRVLVGQTSGNVEIGAFHTYTRFVQGALPSGRYYFRAQAVNACGGGPMSVERIVDVP